MLVRGLVPSFLLFLLAVVGSAAPAGAQLITLEPVLNPVSSATQPIIGKLDPLLAVRVPNLLGRSQVIVRAASAAALPAVSLLIQQTGGILGRQLPLIDAVVANVPNASLAVLTNNSLVQRIALDRQMGGTLKRTGDTVGAALARELFGYDGSGVGVAVVDSGVTEWHDDLSAPGSPGAQRVSQFVDFVNGRAASYDDYGHGTHVAGIVAGNGFDSGGARSGVAPGAHLVVLKVLDGAGRGRISNVIAALDYIVRYRDVYGIRIANLSIGAGVYESYESDMLTVAAKRAVEAGIVVVASAGNAGKDNSGREQYGAITAPGNAPWVLTVGASSHNGTVDRGDDAVAGFSSRGPTAIDRAAKPDLLAPGVGIESLSAPNSYLYNSKSDYRLSGTVATSYQPYLSLSGTSQAAPVVAGTIALMLQANPGLTPNAVKVILQYTAEARPDYDALTQGTGFLNARSAIELARYLRSSLSYSRPSTTGWSLQLIWGNRRLLDGRPFPTASAWRADVVWGAATTPDGRNVSWGAVCSGPNCPFSGTWSSWGTSCMDASCHSISWGSGRSENVVWGTTCGGDNCSSSTRYELYPELVKPTSDGETVVWGTTWDGDTVVWGTTDGETVVWGTTGDEDVLWGGGGGCCEEPDDLPLAN